MSALKLALTTPDLEQRYLAGEKVFSGDKAQNHQTPRSAG